MKKLLPFLAIIVLMFVSVAFAGEEGDAVKEFFNSITLFGVIKWVCIGAIALYILAGFTIIHQTDRGVKYTLGKFSSIMDPGLRHYFPIIQSAIEIDVRVKSYEIPDQNAITSDGVPLRVSGVVFYKIVDAGKAINNVEKVDVSVANLAQTTIKNVIGESTLDDALKKREESANNIQNKVEKDTKEWGIKIENIELKDIEPDEGMKRAMAKEAESEKERKSRKILADGELEAAEKLSEASKKMAGDSNSMLLRFMQMITDVSAEKTTTMILPIPVEFMKMFQPSNKSATAA